MSSRPTVLVYEFFSAGGSAEISAGLADEALGMLWALLTDFRRWGAVRTVTALDTRLDERIPGLNRNTLPADSVYPTSPADARKTYGLLLNSCNAALIVAPETDGVLRDLLREAELAGKMLLSSTSSAASIAGNKLECHRLFQKAKLPTPRTGATTFDSAAGMADRLGFPLIAKPLDGVGCEGVCRVDSASDLPDALALIRRITKHDRILLQACATGVHASASLLISRGRSIALSLNRQLIEAGSCLQYRGSQVPFDHPEGASAVELAASAARLIPGLQGYVGVDLVLADDGTTQLIEINPRVTTSYIGLRQVCRINPAQAIWEACVDGVLPPSFPLAGQIVVKKDDPETWGERPFTI